MSSDNRYLVIGADGMIGAALAGRLRSRGVSVVETTRRPDKSPAKVLLDLNEDPEDWNVPDSVVVSFLCAGVTSLERCRMDPAATRLVNVRHTVGLARRLVSQGSFVVFLSTNLVFDGQTPFQRADSEVNPRTEYGRQKADAEAGLLILGESVSVVRLTKVLAPGMRLFEEWKRALHNQQTIHPFSDRVMSPVSVGLVAEVLERVACHRLPGILQVSGDRDLSYADAARHMAVRLGISQSLIEPVKAESRQPALEPAPRHTTLDTSRLRQELGLRPPDLHEAFEGLVGAGCEVSR